MYERINLTYITGKIRLASLSVVDVFVKTIFVDICRFINTSVCLRYIALKLIVGTIQNMEVFSFVEG